MLNHAGCFFFGDGCQMMDKLSFSLSVYYIEKIFVWCLEFGVWRCLHFLFVLKIKKQMAFQRRSFGKWTNSLNLLREGLGMFFFLIRRLVYAIFFNTNTKTQLYFKTKMLIIGKYFQLFEPQNSNRSDFFYAAPMGL